ncbi:uncharacterized protein LOC133903610 [Phragmites australis]|uniref:uncharacterized protein LOC133903610 n=1 Tax=Phragmites australis TaxID=29695 RepID=UPI002D76B49A|nr:uncharacterized protein LOC133903610 [Phragmites australis]
MAGGLIHLWKEWEIQILVLLSFTLQVFLLAFARIRRRKGSALLRILLWLAYLMADSTAIYTLGHLSLRARSGEKQLVAFWAPLLLLHLGGPDTITAYAFEDNQLWLRHLLTLAVQVMGAAYVLYQAVASQRTLVLPSLLIFVTGLLKYGERTWALKCANIDSIRSSLDVSDDRNRRQPFDGRVRTTELDAEEVLLGAHYMFNACKSLFADDLITSGPEQDAIAQGIQFNGGKYMYELIEMQLSLMYDILYTKADVIYTWYGSCIRVISPLATLAALLLFELKSSYAYKRVDVIVTYILLLGAFVLEITSLVRAIGSSWTCAFLHARKWDRIHGAVLCLRRLFGAASSRRWLHSVGQYNLLDFCTRDTTELRSRITKKVGLEDWWNKLHYSSTTGISDSIRDLLLEEIPRRQLGDMRNARGRWILHRRGIYDDIRWSVDDIDFDQSILIWHVATDVYLCNRQQDADRIQNAERLVAKAVKELSDYMLYLYVVHPYMLPGPVRKSRYANNCDDLVTLWKEHSTQSPDQDRDSELTPRENLARYLYREFRDASDNDSSPPVSIQMEEKNPHDLAYIDGAALAGTLLSPNSGIQDVMEMIAGVWIEMLCYAARHCSEVSHAKQLSSGGELVTAMELLVEYTAKYDFHPHEIDDGAPAQISMENGNPSGTAAEVFIDLDNVSTGAAGEIVEEHDAMNGAANETGEGHPEGRPNA